MEAPKILRGQSLTGLRYGRLKVGVVVKVEKYIIFYSCLCDCGVIKTVPRYALLKGQSKSCGCLRVETTVARSTTHGKYRLPERRVYTSMLTRCYNKNYHDYANYGGRGITVSDSWKSSFEVFLSDMGPRPDASYQLERKENDKGYSKDNCMWATKKQNARNKRNTVWVDYKGVKMSLPEASEIAGLDYHAVFYRYQRGDREDRLFRPSLKQLKS